MVDTDITKVARSYKILLLLAIFSGIALRFVLRPSTALWEDEIIASTHAMQPFLQLIVSVAMNDIHPPLYFLQLHLWALVADSDRWFIANSILYSLAAIVSLYYVMRRIGDEATALSAAACFAVMPAALWMSEEVRPYAWLSVLLIWMLHFVTRAFAAPAPRKTYIALILILGWAIIYSHAIGFVAVAFFGLYAASILFDRQASRRDWLLWLGTFFISGLMLLPMLASDLVHPADMPPPVGVGSIIEWLASVVTGTGAGTDGVLRVAGITAYSLVAILGTAYQPTRRITLCFLVGPMLLCVSTSLVVRPLFKTNFFCNFLSPFLAIIIARLLVAIPAKARSTVAACVLALLTTMAVFNRSDLPLSDYYQKSASIITSEGTAGDAVWVPQTDIYWGLAWYMIGPNWGSPLDTAAPMRPGSHWQRIFNQLSPDLIAKLHMSPASQSVTTKSGIPLVIGGSSGPQLSSASRIWLVTYEPRGDLPNFSKEVALGRLHLARIIIETPLTIRLYEQNHLPLSRHR